MTSSIVRFRMVPFPTLLVCRTVPPRLPHLPFTLTLFYDSLFDAMLLCSHVEGAY